MLTASCCSWLPRKLPLRCPCESTAFTWIGTSCSRCQLLLVERLPLTGRALPLSPLTASTGSARFVRQTSSNCSRSNDSATDPGLMISKAPAKARARTRRQQVHGARRGHRISRQDQRRRVLLQHGGRLHSWRQACLCSTAVSGHQTLALRQVALTPWRGG